MYIGKRKDKKTGEKRETLFASECTSLICSFVHMIEVMRRVVINRALSTD